MSQHLQFTPTQPKPQALPRGLVIAACPAVVRRIWRALDPDCEALFATLDEQNNVITAMFVLPASYTKPIKIKLNGFELLSTESGDLDSGLLNDYHTYLQQGRLHSLTKRELTRLLAEFSMPA